MRGEARRRHQRVEERVGDINARAGHAIIEISIDIGFTHLRSQTISTRGAEPVSSAHHKTNKTFFSGSSESSVTR